MSSYAQLHHHTETREQHSQHLHTTHSTNSTTLSNDYSRAPTIKISDPSKLRTPPSYYYPTSYSTVPNYPASPQQAGMLIRSASVRYTNNPHRAYGMTIKRQQEKREIKQRIINEPEESTAQLLQPKDVHNNGSHDYGAPLRMKSMPEVPTFAKKILITSKARLPNYSQLTASPTVPNSQTYGNYAELKSPSLYRPSNQNDFAGGSHPVPTQYQGEKRSLSPSNIHRSAKPHCEYSNWTVSLQTDSLHGNDDVQPHATMETRVAGQGQPKRVGRWTLAQLRQTDGIIPSQAGWNKGDSQKLMTNFGTPRNTSTRVKAENLAEIPEEILLRSHGEVRLQSGTNKFDSQRGMTGFGTGRDVCREGVHVNQLPSDVQPLPEEKIRLSDGIVRLQAGTNKYDSQKGMTGFGTSRRETTKMLDTKHPEYDHEHPDQSEIPLQAGTNRFASQKGMTGFGTSRRETTRIVDTAHPEYDPESSIDATTIPSQMGSNKYASQKGMTGFGQPRWEVLDPSISWQNRKSQGMVRLQSGTNRFASQQGMTGFGTIRNTTYEAEAGELPYEDMKKSETIIPSQAGWNRGDSQKGMTGFGAPRDVKGKHLKRIWELEYPEEAEVSLDRL